MLYTDKCMHGIPFRMMIEDDDNSLEQYINNFVMNSDEEIQGPLLNILPIVLRINISEIVIDISGEKKVLSLI